MVTFTHSDEDLAVRIGDRITQLILDQFKTLEMQAVAKLDKTGRGCSGFGSAGLSRSYQPRPPPPRVSVLDRLWGKSHIKKTTNTRKAPQFIPVQPMNKLMTNKEQVFLSIMR